MAQTETICVINVQRGDRLILPNRARVQTVHRIQHGAGAAAGTITLDLDGPSCTLRRHDQVKRAVVAAPSPAAAPAGEGPVK